MSTKPIQTPKPLKSGSWLVLESQDKSSWVVCGHKCAARIDKPVCGRSSAVEYALSNPQMFKFD